MLGKEISRRDFILGGSLLAVGVFAGKLPAWVAELSEPKDNSVDYFSLWEKRGGLENLQPNEGLNFRLKEGTFRLIYRGNNQLFVDIEKLGKFLSPLLPPKETKPRNAKDQPGWFWQIDLIEKREDFPESLRTNLMERARDALMNSSPIPVPMEKVCPITFTLKEEEDHFLTYVCSEPTGKINLSLLQNSQESPTLIPENESPYLARSFRASYFLFSEILKVIWSIDGHPRCLLKMPVFEVLSPQSLWTFAQVSSPARFNPNFLFLFPAPADYQLPSLKNPLQPVFQI